MLIIISFNSAITMAQDELYPFPFSVPNKSGFLPSSEAVNSLYKDFNFTASYTNNLFLSQIGLSKIKLVYPSAKINTCTSLSFYGYSNFWNLKSTIGFSRHFKPYISFGVTAFFVFYRFSLTGKNLFTAGVNASLCIFPTKKICIGVSAENISFSPLKSGDRLYRLPVTFKIGFSLMILNNFSISLEGSKELKSPFLICSGIEYTPLKQFALRFGVSYQTNASILAGFGLRLKSFFIDFDAFYNLGSGIGCRAAIGFSKFLIKN